jgi:hypothetical protein
MITTALLALGVPSFAHEGGRHERVMGTVRAVDDRQLTLKTTNGKDLSIQLDQETGCSEGGQEAHCSAIKPGDRVVAKTRTKDGTVTADEIRFSSGKDSRAATSSATTDRQSHSGSDSAAGH